MDVERNMNQGWRIAENDTCAEEAESAPNLSVILCQGRPKFQGTEFDPHDL
jgi:hypothetical protein